MATDVHLVVPPALTATPGPVSYGLVVPHPLDATFVSATTYPVRVTCARCQDWITDYRARQRRAATV